MNSSVRSNLGFLVAGTAGSVLFTEIALTRLFSVLFYYHYSFLAIGIALFGLAAGGLIAARYPVGDSPEAFQRRVRSRLLGAGVALLGLVVVLAILPSDSGDLQVAVGLAAISAVPLTFLGEVLARALASGRQEIHRLYAVDLASSAVAALVTIPLLQHVQGPFALGIPAVCCLLLTLVTGEFRARGGVTLCVGALLALIILAVVRSGPLISLADPWFGRPLLERWNSHSRVRVRESGPLSRELVIDRTALSVIPYVPPGIDGPPGIDSSWALRYPDPSYSVGRPSDRVAVIGVGGGPDVLPALAAGAKEVVGFELNGLIVNVLTKAMLDFNSIALRPELRLVHDEARHALRRRPERFDIIRASLTDTWASTAAGGFVLSENSLYTVEAWRLFLDRLTPTGILATTRWYLPEAPAEAERLIALAAQALAEEGMIPAGARLVAVASPSRLFDPLGGGAAHLITTLVSPTPFGPEEVEALETYLRQVGGELLIAPHRAPAPAARSWSALLTSRDRARHIRNSRWNIDPPRDTKPFFFLQLRPLDFLKVRSTDYGPVSAITMNGVRVLVATVILAMVGALLLLWLAARVPVTLEGSPRAISHLRRSGRFYFALIGLGYMAIQVALHQRLSILLGHPTATLALVLAAMLLGTGVGSAGSGYPPLRDAPRLTLAVPPLAVALLVGLAFPLIGLLNNASTLSLAAIGAGVLSGGMGLALGVALPTGLRLFADGERAVAESWAINGAFSVLGAALAALAGLVVGSRWLAASAFPCYVVVWLLIHGMNTKDVTDEGLPAPPRWLQRGQ